MITGIVVENMSHLTSSFPLREHDVDDIHPTQATKKKIKLILYFLIPGEAKEDQNEEDANPEDLPRFASVRVPKGVPVAKLRLLIRHVESELMNIYGRTKRVNFVLVSEGEDDNPWKYEFDLPTFGVVYV